MTKSSIVLRFLTGIVALPKHWLDIINNLGRDAENRRRFPNVTFDSGVCMTKDTIIGDYSHIMRNCLINNSKIGLYTYTGANTIIQNSIIGNYCSIANDVMCGLGNHPIDGFSTSPVFYRKNNPLNISIVEDGDLSFEYKQIIIGNDVWIGARATIMDGVSIGNGAVIGAGAVVTKDVPSFAIVVGVPAKVIKYRLDDEYAMRLVNLEWWNDAPDEVLMKLSK